MDTLRITLEQLYRLLPQQEELEGLRSSFAGAATLDPDKEWARSRAYATIDKRVVSLQQIETALDEAEAATHRYVDSLFSGFRPLFRNFCVGRGAEAARQLIELGERQEEAGRMRSAREFFETALTLALPLVDKEPQIVALRRIARLAAGAGELEEASRFYGRSAELARDVGDVRNEVIARTGAGNALALGGRWAEAEQCYRQALSLAECPAPDDALPLECAQLCNNLGMVATRQNRLEEAEEWLAGAQERWGAVHSPVDLGVCLHNVAELRRRQERHPEARTLYEQVLALEVPSWLRALAATDLAESYLHDGLLDRAEASARAAEEHAIAARSAYHLSHMYRGLGNIARAKGDEDGITFFEKSLELARAKNLELLEGETLVDYARLRVQMGGAEEAQGCLEYACEIFARLGAVEEEVRARRQLAALPPVGLEAC